jgi:transcriptional regulator with XRE-family HTH domain
MPTAAQLLTLARNSAGLSQAGLARRAQVPRSVVCAYERGRRDPGVAALAALLTAAGVEVRLAKAPPIDVNRAARILADVLDLAELLPFRRRRSLPPSPFAALRR